MKSTSAVLLFFFLSHALHAEFREWTNSAGKKAELDLVAASEEGGEKVGQFKMRNGTTVKIKASGLSADDAKQLADWNPPFFKSGPQSVFDEAIEHNLVRLEKGEFAALAEFARPKKYYLFYYTASWCPPCRAFTPTLVDWYEKNKNDNFELVLITADREEPAMLGYAKEKKMPWPQVAFGKSMQFQTKHAHGVRGIPSLIVCDLEGKILGNFRSQLPQLTDLIKE